MIDVLAYDREHRFLGYVAERLSPTFQEQMNAPGAASFQLPLSAAILTSQPELLQYGNIMKMRTRDGYVFPWILQKKERVLADEGEMTSLVWEISGEGALALLRDMVLYPEYGLPEQEEQPVVAASDSVGSRMLSHHNPAPSPPSWGRFSSLRTTFPLQVSHVAVRAVQVQDAPVDPAVNRKIIEVFNADRTVRLSYSEPFDTPLLNADGTGIPIKLVQPVALNPDTNYWVGVRATHPDFRGLQAYVSNEAYTGGLAFPPPPATGGRLLDRASATFFASSAGVALAESVSFVLYGSSAFTPGDQTITRYPGLDRHFTHVSRRGPWYEESQWLSVTGPRYADSTDRRSSLGDQLPWGWRDPDARWVWPELGPVAPRKVYFRGEYTTAERTLVDVYATADDGYELWIDGQQVVSGSNWQQIQHAQYMLEPGPHVIAGLCWNNVRADQANNSAGLLFSVIKRGPTTEPPVVLIRSGPGIRMRYADLLPKPGWNAGQVVRQVLVEARERSTSPRDAARLVTPTWANRLDSEGIEWPRILERSFEIGSDYLDMLEQLQEMACDFRMNGDLGLELYVDAGTDRAAGNLRDAYQLYEWRRSFYLDPSTHDPLDPAGTHVRTEWSTTDEVPPKISDAEMWHEHRLRDGSVSRHRHTVVENQPPVLTGNSRLVGKAGDRNIAVALQLSAQVQEAGYEGDSSGIKTNVLVLTNRFARDYRDAEAKPEWGRREGYLQVGNAESDAQARGLMRGYFTEHRDPSKSITLTVAPSSLFLPFRDFFVGDWVLAPAERGGLDRLRVRAVSVTEDDNGVVTYVPELATIQMETLARFNRWLKSMAKGTLGGDVASASPVMGGGGGPGVGDGWVSAPGFDSSPGRIGGGDGGTGYAGKDWKDIVAGDTFVVGLTRMPTEGSVVVSVNGLEQVEGRDWAQENQTVRLLPGSGCRAGDYVEVRYLYGGNAFVGEVF